MLTGFSWPRGCSGTKPLENGLCLFRFQETLSASDAQTCTGRHMGTRCHLREDRQSACRRAFLQSHLLSGAFA